jgi:hypothetical protein
MQYKIEDEKIIKMYTSKANKEGKPYVSKKGNPFSKVDIYIDKEAIDDSDFEGKMTYFDYFENMINYGEGATITGTITKTEVGQYTYFNFEFPASGKKALEEDVRKLQADVEELKKEVFGKLRREKEQEVKEARGFSKELLKDEEEDDEMIEDLPF